MHRQKHGSFKSVPKGVIHMSVATCHARPIGLDAQLHNATNYMQPTHYRNNNLIPTSYNRQKKIFGPLQRSPIRRHSLIPSWKLCVDAPE